MFNCEICDYSTNNKQSMNRHCDSKKHKLRLSHQRREKKKFDLSTNDLELEVVQLKMQLGFQSELAKSQLNAAELKGENKALKYQKEALEYKYEALESKHEALESQYKLREICHHNYNSSGAIINNNNIQNIQQNSININGGNNQAISKKNELNINFGNIIDIDTFTKNYEHKYPLTYEQTKTLLENYKTLGLKSYGDGLYAYLKKNCAKQLEDIFGENIDEVVLPFVLTDASLRSHLEKDSEEGWKYEQAMNKIKKIVIISNDQIFKYHRQRIPLGPRERTIVANSLLRCSGYPTSKSMVKKNKYKF